MSMLRPDGCHRRGLLQRKRSQNEGHDSSLEITIDLKAGNSEAGIMDKPVAEYFMKTR